MYVGVQLIFTIGYELTEQVLQIDYISYVVYQCHYNLNASQNWVINDLINDYIIKDKH